MKKSFIKIIFSTIVLSLGFSSCKKNSGACKDCATYKYNGQNGDTFCVGDNDVETQAKFDAYVSYLRSQGYTVTQSKSCQ